MTTYTVATKQPGQPWQIITTTRNPETATKALRAARKSGVPAQITKLAARKVGA